MGPNYLKNKTDNTCSKRKCNPPIYSENTISSVKSIPCCIHMCTGHDNLTFYTSRTNWWNRIHCKHGEKSKLSLAIFCIMASPIKGFITWFIINEKYSAL